MGSGGEVITQAALIESYKAQKAVSAAQNTLADLDVQAFWTAAKNTLRAELGETAFVTWLAPCQCRLDDKGLTLLTSSDFSRGLLAQRYGDRIRQVCSALTDGQIQDFRIAVDPTAISESPIPQASAIESKPVSTEATPKSPWAAHQNPANDPEVALLLERYGDMRGVIFKHPLFKAPCTPVSEGGWGIGYGAMINAGKQYTLQRLLWAVRQTKAYPGANNRGQFFFHVLRKGLEPGKF